MTEPRIHAEVRRPAAPNAKLHALGALVGLFVGVAIGAARGALEGIQRVLDE